MIPVRTCLVLALAAPLAPPAAPLPVPAEGEIHTPPPVGAIAKPLETVYWYALGADRREPTVAAYRGRVLLVHSWGYYCDTCVREGVPYVVDLMRAHASDGLAAVSITVPVEDGKPDDHFVKVGREMGLQHALGVADGFGEMTPYVNMNVNGSLTWCFVIGREGGVRWAGDPSREGEEFLDAVRRALFEEPLPPLPESVPAELEEAVARYVAGDLAKARDLAERARTKLEKSRTGGDAAAADLLIAAIDGHRDALLARLAAAREQADARDWVVARRTLLARFPKTDAAKRVAELDELAAQDEAFEDAVEGWTRWLELRDEAPALFPARVDRGTKRYAKSLAKFVDRQPGDAPGVAEARAWLAAFEAG